MNKLFSLYLNSFWRVSKNEEKGKKWDQDFSLNLTWRDAEHLQVPLIWGKYRRLQDGMPPLKKEGMKKKFPGSPNLLPRCQSITRRKNPVKSMVGNHFNPCKFYICIQSRWGMWLMLGSCVLLPESLRTAQKSTLQQSSAGLGMPKLAHLPWKSQFGVGEAALKAELLLP